jgi:hypothetical protein
MTREESKFELWKMQVWDEVIVKSLSNDRCLKVVMRIWDGEQSHCLYELQEEVFKVYGVPNLRVLDVK